MIDVLSEDRTWAEQYVATGELRVPFDKASIGWKKAISEHKVYKALSAYDSVPELLGSVLKVSLDGSSTPSLRLT